jgi:hypothetical protein
MMISRRRVAGGIIAVVLLIAAFPLVHAGFATPDDFVYSRWAHSEKRWEYAWDAASAMGRFQMPFHIALNLVPYAPGNELFLKTLQIGGLVVTLLLFGHTVARLADDVDDGLLAVLLGAALLPNMWEHFPYAAYPFVFAFGASVLMLALLAFRRDLDGAPRRFRLASALLFLVAALTYESFLVYCVVFVLLAWQRKAKDGPRAVLGACAPILATVLLYVMVYLAWRAANPSTYSGSQLVLDAPSLLRAARVVWQFAVAALPGYVFTHFDAIHYRFAASPEGFGRGVGALLTNARVEWVIKALLVAFGVYLLQSDRGAAPRRRRLAGPALLGVLLFLIPALPLALTPKYQQWVAEGTPAYLVTFFSYFGVIVVLTALAAYLGTSPSGRRPRRAVTVATAIAAALLGVVTDYGNQAMHRSQALNGQRWTMFRALMASEDFEQVQPGSRLLLSGLTTSLVLGGYGPYVWQAWVQQQTGKAVTVFDDRAAFLAAGTRDGRPGFIVRYEQEENAPNQLIAIARVAGSEHGELTGDRVVVLWSGIARRFALLLRAAGAPGPAVARINGVDVRATGAAQLFPVDASSRRGGVVRAEVQMPHLSLDAVSATTFLD